MFDAGTRRQAQCDCRSGFYAVSKSSALMLTFQCSRDTLVSYNLGLLEQSLCNPSATPNMRACISVATQRAQHLGADKP